MNVKQIAVCTLLFSFVPSVCSAGGRGGGGGFDFHSEAPQSYSHSSTGPAGTSRTTTASSSANGVSRSTSASNGSYSRNVSSGASNGSYNRNTSASNGYASHNSSSSANANTGNYSRNASGSNATGSYSSSASGNTHNGTYNRTTNGSNAYGETYHGSTTGYNGTVYHGSTTSYNGTVYHGAVVANPVYHGAYGWNGGVAWYPAPTYWGGGFWGAMAIGATSAAVYGAIVANNQSVTSYQVQPESPGAKLLASYQLSQTPCGPPGLVVVYGPNNSVICAFPNGLVSAGNYSVDSSTLTIVSQNP